MPTSPASSGVRPAHPGGGHAAATRRVVGPWRCPFRNHDQLRRPRCANRPRSVRSHGRALAASSVRRRCAGSQPDAARRAVPPGDRGPDGSLTGYAGGTVVVGRARPGPDRLSRLDDRARPRRRRRRRPDHRDRDPGRARNDAREPHRALPRRAPPVSIAFPRQGEGPAGACQFWAWTMLMASRSASGSAVTLIGFPGLPVATVIGVSVLLPLPTT